MPSLQGPCSQRDRACCADSLDPIQGSQGNQKQRHAQPRTLTPLLDPKMNFRDDCRFMENVACQDKAVRNNSEEMESHTAQFDYLQIEVQTQSPELCKCKKRASETRDAGTQTPNIPVAETCDASTQSSFVIDSAAKANLCLPPVDVSVQHPATGRQSDTAAEPNTHTPSPGKTRSGEKHTPWSKNKSRAGSPSGGSDMNKCTDDDSDGKAILQTHKTPF